MKSFRLLAFLWAFTAAASQDNLVSATVASREDSLASTLLAAPDPLSRTWGAYLVGKYSLRNHAEALVAELTRLRDLVGSLGRDDYERVSQVQVLLDALIQLQHRVDPEILLPFRTGWSAEVTILLATNRERSVPELLALLDDDLRCEQWLAVNNLLADAKAPGYSAKLLRATEYRLAVQVTDEGEALGFGGGFGGGTSWDGYTAHARGYPPAAVYRLTLSPSFGDVMLARGSKPVYYRRIMVPMNQALAYGLAMASCDRQREMGNYLGGLAGFSNEEIRQTFQPQVYINRKGLSDYNVRLKNSIQGQVYRIRRLVQTLAERGLLSEDDARQLRPVIHVDITDSRSHGEPLPELAPVQVELN